MQALTAWQVVPLTVQTINHYNLWETRLFSRFVALRPITEDVVVASQLAAATSAFTSFALLKEVNTYTHRTADYLLSSAQDYRKGTLNAQVHAWQATLDADAIVFTQHPAVPIVQSTNWRDDPDPGYWTGEAAMPRSAQHENVAIHVYAPQYAGTNPPPLDAFRYEPYTHAYVPQDRFDAVVQDGAWTFARRGDGYVALYSYRPSEWIINDPAVVATDGMMKPFDLRATGGSDNVWIVECGRRADAGSFEQFRAAISAAAIAVTARPAGATGLSGGFDVAYDSPSQGMMTFVGKRRSPSPALRFRSRATRGATRRGRRPTTARPRRRWKSTATASRSMSRPGPAGCCRPARPSDGWHAAHAALRGKRATRRSSSPPLEGSDVFRPRPRQLQSAGRQSGERERRGRVLLQLRPAAARQPPREQHRRRQRKRVSSRKSATGCRPPHRRTALVADAQAPSASVARRSALWRLIRVLDEEPVGRPRR